MGTIPQLSDCKPGFDPVEYNVLIAPEEVEEKTASGLYLPQQSKEREDLAQIRGLLVAASPLAFNFDEWPTNAPPRPQPGDLVIYGKYAGILIKGDDGREYRLCKDKDVCAVVRRSEGPQVKRVEWRADSASAITGY